MNELKIIRGTTQSITVTIENNSGGIYNLQDGDVLKFGVKRNWQNTEYDIYKEVTSSDAQGDGYVISLSPEETTDILPGREYKFDVGIQTATGDYFMVIPCSKCVIIPAVTQKEVIE